MLLQSYVLFFELNSSRDKLLYEQNIVVVVVSPILITTFLPEAQRYVTMAALRGAVRPSSSSIKSCNIHLVLLPGTALVKKKGILFTEYYEHLVVMPLF